MTTNAPNRVPTQPPPLAPAHFSVVMATGIVSLASYSLGVESLARILFALNAAAYGALWLATLRRLVREPRRLLGEMGDPLRGPGYFAAVAATGILGSQCLALADAVPAAAALLGIALVLWCGLTYAILVLLATRPRKPPLDRGLDGGWLLAVVATQSLAVLGPMLAAAQPGPARQVLDFAALAFWLCGIVLYLWIMGLIFYRQLFLPLAPADLTPPYWINMGAMAISALAGAQLAADAAAAPWLNALQPFLGGVTVLCWAAGTWWIPLLLALYVWRHAVRRVPVSYDAQWWSAVFPLGMYAEATHRMIAALSLDFLAWLPPLFWIAALAGWLAAGIGLVRRLLRR